MMSDPVVMRFDVTGMMCAACSSRLERVLAMQEGVAGAVVNLATAVATVTLASDADEEAVARAVAEAAKKAGFHAEPRRSDADGNVAFLAKTAEAREDVALRRRRLLPEALLTAAVILVSMGHMVGMPVVSQLHAHTLAHAVVQLVLVIPVLLLGRSFYISGIPRLLHGMPNMDSLISLGTGAAFLYSLWGTFEIACGDGATAERAAEGLYFESCAMLITLVSVGKYLEVASKARLTEAMGAFLSLSPRTAFKVVSSGSGEKVDEIPLRDVSVGDLLEVKAGMRIPVDGVVVDGMMAVDASMLTGESVPVSVSHGDAVTGGTLAVDGYVRMRALRIGADTVLARMAEMVREAQNTKAPIAGMADRVSLVFVPVVLFAAVASGLAWYLIGDMPFGEALRVFVAVTVVACPCALGLATPLSIMVGTGRGAGLGVLVKNGAALEAAGRVSTVVFDKTGTLTTGRQSVVDVVRLAEITEDGLLGVAAALERVSPHPLAHAIMSCADARGLAIPSAADVVSTPGLGLRGKIDGRDVLIGNVGFLSGNGVDVRAFSMPADELARKGETAVLVALDGVPSGIIGIADVLRREALDTVDAIKAMGVRVILLTGDSAVTAEAFGRQAHIEDIRAGVRPEDKVAAIVELQNAGEVVGMVGDGVNDAPALARADVGLAMSTGIDVAVDAGDMVLVGGDAGRGLAGVLTALRLGRATLLNIRENLAWAFGYNIILLPIAAGVLKLFGGPVMSPVFAGAAMACSSISVVLNSMRLSRFKG